MEKETLLDDVAAYYSAKLALHGAVPRGVDWNGEESQKLRFEQLTGILKQRENFSLNDLGCGYGALYEYLKSRHRDFAYQGFDVSPDMILAASQRHARERGARFIVSAAPTAVAQYGIASGIFNVRLGRSDVEWRRHIETSLDALDRTSQLGFSFNCLTSHSDPERMLDYLYYADPARWFDFCKQRYSRNVALLHDYDLYEFTILVRK